MSPRNLLFSSDAFLLLSSDGIAICHKLALPRRKEPQLRNCLDQMGLGVCPWEFSGLLIEPAVGGAFLGRWVKAREES